MHSNECRCLHMCLWPRPSFKQTKFVKIHFFQNFLPRGEKNCKPGPCPFSQRNFREINPCLKIELALNQFCFGGKNFRKKAKGQVYSFFHRVQKSFRWYLFSLCFCPLKIKYVFLLHTILLLVMTAYFTPVPHWLCCVFCAEMHFFKFLCTTTVPKQRERPRTARKWRCSPGAWPKQQSDSGAALRSHSRTVPKTGPPAPSRADWICFWLGVC